MAEEISYYVPRHEFEKTKGRLHQRINEVDQKHDDKYHSLEIAIVAMTEVNKQMVEVNKDVKTELVKLNSTMSQQNDEIKDIKYKTEKNTEDIEENKEELKIYKEEVKKRQKDNITLLKWFFGLFMGGGGLVPFIGLFFK